MTAHSKTVRNLEAKIPTDIPSLAILLKMLGLRYFRFFLMLSLVVGGVSWVRANYFQQRKFKSMAVIMPRSKGTADAFASKSNGVLAALGASVSSATQDVQQLQALLKSDRLATASFDSLQKRYANLNERDFSFDISLSGLIFILSATGPTAELAAEFLAIHLDELQKIMSENQSRQSNRAVGFISARIEEVKANLDEIETRLGKLRAGERFDLKKTNEVELIHAKRDYQIQSTMLETLSQQKEVAQIDAKREEQMFVIIDPPVKSLRPFSPAPNTSAGYGAFFGALMALIVTLFLYRTNRLGFLSAFEAKGRL